MSKTNKENKTQSSKKINGTKRKKKNQNRRIHSLRKMSRQCSCAKKPLRNGKGSDKNVREIAKNHKEIDWKFERNRTGKNERTWEKRK